MRSSAPLSSPATDVVDQHEPPAERSWNRKSQEQAHGDVDHPEEGSLGPPPGGDGPGRRGDVEGDSAQPGGQRLLLPDRTGLGGQYQERSLEGVLGARLMAEYVAANVKHHGTMPAD